MDLTTLQQQLTDSTTSNIADKLFQWVILPSIISLAIVLVLYIAHVIRRRKIENAIFEIRDLLRDMKDTPYLAAAKQENTPRRAPDPETPPGIDTAS